MTVKIPTEHYLELLSLKRGYTGRLSLFMSKCHIVGNHMSRLNYNKAHEMDEIFYVFALSVSVH